MLFCEYSLCLYGRHLQQIQHLQSLRAAEYWEVCISYTQCDMQKVFTNFHSLGYCGTLLQNTGDSKVLAVNVTVDFYLLLKSEYQILHYITNFTKVIPFECVCVYVSVLYNSLIWKYLQQNTQVQSGHLPPFSLLFISILDLMFLKASSSIFLFLLSPILKDVYVFLSKRSRNILISLLLLVFVFFGLPQLRILNFLQPHKNSQKIYFLWCCWEQDVSLHYIS